ncbi:hypothetical protein MO867_19300 [Microbulbifer sp. OS29]|uniref:Uncharacterized protein n=1 Tax=Microbulbifer okhotskensis TaxID=2926617 RepID=A0A9X2EQF0_9GAMM|nr:hypothetical protein [Microbulbifer okhotskensis]MCO1336482.1 hypothetical protein [Microbulbifer okhotskensis]
MDVQLVSAAIMIRISGFVEAMINGVSFSDALVSGIYSVALTHSEGGGGGYIDRQGTTGKGFLIKVLKSGVVGGIASIFQIGEFGCGLTSTFVGILVFS